MLYSELKEWFRQGTGITKSLIHFLEHTVNQNIIGARKMQNDLLVLYLFPLLLYQY